MGRVGNCPYRFGQKSNAALAAVVVHVALLLTHPALGSCLHPLVSYAILYTAFTYKYVSNIGPRLLIHFSGLEEILGFWECEHRPYQWPLVSLVPMGTLQVRIRFVRQRFNPTLETNKQTFPITVFPPIRPAFE